MHCRLVDWLVYSQWEASDLAVRFIWFQTQQVLQDPDIEDGTYVLRPSGALDKDKKRFLTLSVRMDFPQEWVVACVPRVVSSYSVACVPQVSSYFVACVPQVVSFYSVACVPQVNSYSVACVPQVVNSYSVACVPRVVSSYSVACVPQVVNSYYVPCVPQVVVAVLLPVSQDV